MKLAKKALRVPMKVLLGAQVAAISMFACGKKDSKSDEAASNISAGQAGVIQVEGNEVVMLGQLALSASLRLADVPKGILAFNLVKGVVQGDPQKIEVSEDGSFSVPLQKADEALDFLLAEMEKDRADRDYEAMAAAVQNGLGMSHVTAEYLEAMSDEELNEGLTEEVKENQQGGKMTVLVSYDVTGDVVTEAESFQFINLPTASGASLSAIPNRDLIGSVSLGEISGEGSDITASIEAGDVLDLSPEAIDTLAGASQTLKLLKNVYMNDTWGVTPFYAWQSNVAYQDVIGSYYDVNENSYYGYGTYIPQEYNSDDAGFTFAQICGGNKSITFTPPSALTIADNSGQGTSTVTAFSNADPEQQNQGGSNVCLTGSGMYIREDVRDGKTSFMMNVGLGGNIQTMPEGLWKLKLGTTEVGRFELAASSPVNADGKPLVFIPSVQFVKSGNYITEAKIKLYSWNGSSYVQVTDMAPVISLVSDLNASITRVSDNGESRARVDLGSYDEDGAFTVKFDSAQIDGDDPVNPKVASSDVSSFAVYYGIGNASYRIEFRN